MLYLLLILAAAFAIFWIIKTKEIIPSIISLGLIAGIILVMLPIETMLMPGLYIYNLFVALAFVYGLVKKDLTVVARIVITLMSASIFSYWLWVLNHWHGNTVLMVVFTLLVEVIGIFSKAKLRNELGFLVILAVDAIAILIENWMKAN